MKNKCLLLAVVLRGKFERTWEGKSKIGNVKLCISYGSLFDKHKCQKIKNPTFKAIFTVFCYDTVTHKHNFVFIAHSKNTQSNKTYKIIIVIAIFITINSHSNKKHNNLNQTIFNLIRNVK